MRNRFKTSIKTIFIVLTMVLGPVAVWEAWLQFELWVINKDPYEIIMYRDVHHKINEYWNKGYEAKKIFWGPPYNVFLNRGENDPNRLKLIHEKSILPNDKNGLTENFLRPKGSVESSYYNVNVNSLGFRNIERPVEKQANTFRIFVLGSYPAFGSGVNDNETYSAYLEEKLNSGGSKFKIEVWNGGQQGTTAISGLARLKNEIMKYQPDLLIWDFGWVDLYFGKDFVEENSKAQYHYPITQELARIMWRRLPRLLFSRHLYHFINSDFRNTLLEDWKRVNYDMLKFVDEKELPVILLKQRVVIIQNQHYEELAASSKNAKFLNFNEVFRSPDFRISHEQRQEFWSKPNWLSEGGFNPNDSIPDERMFRVDAIMYNKFAHQLVANKLAETILPSIKSDVK